MELRWVLGANRNRIGDISESPDDEEGINGNGFREAFARNVKAVVTRRAGARQRTPTKFFDEVHTPTTTSARRRGVRGKYKEDRRKPDIRKYQCTHTGDEGRCQP